MRVGSASETNFLDETGTTTPTPGGVPTLTSEMVVHEF